MTITIKDFIEKKNMQISESDILATFQNNSFERCLGNNYDTWLAVMKQLNIMKDLLINIYTVIPIDTRVWCHFNKTSFEKPVARMVLEFANHEFVFSAPNDNLISYYDNKSEWCYADSTVQDIKKHLESIISCGNKTLSDI